MLQALLRPTAWEQVSADGIIGDVAKGFSKKYGFFHWNQAI